MQHDIVMKKGISIGEGKPKICVPITGRTEEEIKSQVTEITPYDNELVEWRVDFFDNCKDSDGVVKVLDYLQESLHTKLILFTFRSKREGGEKELTKEEYVELYKKVIVSGKADLIDVELYAGDDVIEELVALAHEYNVYVIMSNHDFEKTPDKDVIVERLMTMQEKNADILKMAVMPRDTYDVLTLLWATNEVQKELARKPVVTMSMSKLGVVSRVCGEIFGSAITFGTVGEASAPGQIPVTSLKEILDLFH